MACDVLYRSAITSCVYTNLHTLPTVETVGLGSVVCIPVLYVRVHYRHIYCATCLSTYLYKVFYKIQIRGKTHDWCFEAFDSWDKLHLGLRLSQSKRQQLLASPCPQGC